ncbi:hypothetical protein BDP27DRAFT_1424937 [Rhodocollybia butyracea]|uniref:Uncharacterized protein n=1 Tax=Rhodocollybia butyracea TaxID=206335 RepID=A0A9P5U495_9AGAR|nr:hypothetical protein BDP27DRAFT_1424937 [Rhodocollybia butyracea]
MPTIPFSQLKEIWYNSISHNRVTWETVKGQQARLSSTAGIATFLAGVQSQIIALSYQDNSTPARLATNITGFAGILLDVITAFLALLASTTIQRHISEVEKQLKTLENFSELPQLVEVEHGLVETMKSERTRGDAGHIHAEIFPDLVLSILARAQNRVLALSAHPKDNKHKLDEASLQLLELMKHGEERLDLMLVKKSCTRIRNLAFLADATGTAMLLGVLCFFASVQSLAIATQPVAVWVVSVVTCSFIIVLPVTNLVLGVFLDQTSKYL